MIFPVLISFVISAVLGPILIPYLRKLKLGQTEREEGVQSHLKKAGTPTMGGIIFLLSTVITSIFFVKDYPKIIPVLFLTLGFGIIGFLDDYLKVVLKRSDGLHARAEDGRSDRGDSSICFLPDSFHRCIADPADPLLPRILLESGMLAIPVLFIAVIGTVNGVNFTDGLDGLCLQRHRSGGYLLFSGGYRNQQRHRSHYLRGGGQL